jgi:phosphate transport system substrate-binding protein
MRLDKLVISSLVLVTFPMLSYAQSALNGAGATFPAPLYSRWISEFEKKSPEIKLNYQPIGSGGGIKQFIDGTVDFAGTDAPMTDEQIAKINGNVIHIPTALGAVVLTYNIPNIGKPLSLTPDALCGIALGKITSWNDRRLTTLNPGTNLPSAPLTFVHRSDGSGTSAIFTDYLSKVCPEWKEKVGSGTSVNWPAGLGSKGNDGVSGLVKQTPNSIGYVELVFAEKNGLPFASLKNKAGKMVLPSTSAVTEAFAGNAKNLPNDFRISITNADGAGSYPISGVTYLLIRKSIPSNVGTPLLKFVRWGLKDGQKIAPTLSYGAIPSDVIAKVEKALNVVEIK